MPFTKEQLDRIEAMISESQTREHAIKVKMFGEESYENFPVPVKGTEDSAAYDIKAPYAFELRSDKPISIRLGFGTELLKGMAAIIQPRSGLGTKDGMEITNTIGLIDSDYRDEWIVTAHLNQFTDLLKFATVNDDGIKVLKIEKGQRFAQFWVTMIPRTKLIPAESLSVTSRKGGLGSTNL